MVITFARTIADACLRDQAEAVKGACYFNLRVTGAKVRKWKVFVCRVVCVVCFLLDKSGAEAETNRNPRMVYCLPHLCVLH